MWGHPDRDGPPLGLEPYPSNDKKEGEGNARVMFVTGSDLQKESHAKAIAAIIARAAPGM